MIVSPTGRYIKNNRNALATAVHVREIAMQVYRFAQEWMPTIRIENPAEAACASAIATFKPREGSLTPAAIRTSVLEAGPALEILAEKQFDDGFDASPVVIGLDLCLRGRRFLYAVARGDGHWRPPALPNRTSSN